MAVIKEATFLITILLNFDHAIKEHHVYIKQRTGKYEKKLCCTPE